MRRVPHLHVCTEGLTRASQRLRLRLRPLLLRAGLFDSHALFSDMYSRPQDFLNGTAPLNVTGAVHSCVYQLNESTSDPGVCTDAVGTDQDSFLW